MNGGIVFWDKRFGIEHDVWGMRLTGCETKRKNDDEKMLKNDYHRRHGQITGSWLDLSW
jgi:hypothetical protein